MTTDYTDPSTVDVDVVMGNINAYYKIRGHRWDDERHWPNVTVKALSDEITRLRKWKEDVKDRFDPGDVLLVVARHDEGKTRYYSHRP